MIQVHYDNTKTYSISKLENQGNSSCVLNLPTRGFHKETSETHIEIFVLFCTTCIGSNKIYLKLFTVKN